MNQSCVQTISAKAESGDKIYQAPIFNDFSSKTLTEMHPRNRQIQSPHRHNGGNDGSTCHHYYVIYCVLISTKPVMEKQIGITKQNCNIFFQTKSSNLSTNMPNVKLPTKMQRYVLTDWQGVILSIRRFVNFSKLGCVKKMLVRSRFVNFAPNYIIFLP